MAMATRTIVNPNDTAQAKPAASEQPILFQTYFKSVGPRTYAAQLKQAQNGNHFLVLTEGNRKKDSDEIRKTRLFVFSEDFPAFFDLIRQAADFVRSHPVEEKVRRKQMAYWKRKSEEGESNGHDSAPQASPASGKPGPDRAAQPSVARDARPFVKPR